MPPKLQSLYDGKELPVVIGIVSFGVGKFLAEVRDRVRVLRQDDADSRARGVGRYVEHFGEIR